MQLHLSEHNGKSKWRAWRPALTCNLPVTVPAPFHRKPIAVYALLLVVWLSACQRREEPPTSPRGELAPPEHGVGQALEDASEARDGEQNKGEMTRDRALRAAEAKARSILKSWQLSPPEKFDFDIREAGEEHEGAWLVLVFYEPEKSQETLEFYVFPNGEVVEWDEQFRREWESLSEEEREERARHFWELVRRYREATSKDCGQAERGDDPAGSRE
jgi:hypothetical protein